MNAHHDRPADTTEALSGDITSTIIRRVLAVGVVLLIVIVGSYLVPVPSVGWVRSFSDGLGSWFPVVFFVMYAVITMLPIPRSAFTVMSGVLFGPVVGFIGALAASMFAAAGAFVIVRRAGRDRVQPYLGKPIVAAIEARLSRRGWLAVASLRLIAACPFAVANYCSALSSVRFTPYLVATFVGMAPGTAAVVFLGDALTGNRNPWLLALTAFFFALGILGLVLDAKLPVSAEGPTPR